MQGRHLHAAPMRIKQLAEATGVPVDTIRHYEKAGLLAPPQRRDNNYRAYDTSALQRLAFIRNCRALDMSLDEVRVLLNFLDQPHSDHSPVDALVAEHLGHVRSRLKSLRQLERQLLALQRACGQAQPHEACGIVLALSQVAAPAKPLPPVRGVHSG